MNILILMAGAGSRFLNSGYDVPKPMIPVSGVPMYRLALDSLNLKGKIIAVTRIDVDIDGVVIKLDQITGGAAESALAAKELIDTNEELVILNADQIIEWNSSDILLASDYDGALLLFKADGDRWSFANIRNDLIVEVAEKRQISNNALAGIHYWKHGSDFVKYAEQMIANRDRQNGEYYIAPVYQYAIDDGKKIFPIFISKMHDLGTPEALSRYNRIYEHSNFVRPPR